MFNIGMPELVLILVLALVIFGPKELPKVGKAVGSGIKEFKKAATDLQKSIQVDEEVKPKKDSAVKQADGE